ncbi:MAG: BolA family protein [Candidatus Sedimenticola endophacoides]
MDNQTVEALIKAGLPECEVHVTGDGRHFEAQVVCAAFAGKPLLQQHRMVKETVKAQLASDELHALSIKTFTPESWAARGG